jgi:hypothetical protein
MRLHLVLALLVSTFFGRMAVAVDAQQSGPWTTPATWVGGVVPTSSDDVVIPNGITVNAASGDFIEANNLTIAGTANFNGGSSAGQIQLAITDSLTISSSGILNGGNTVNNIGFTIQMLKTSTIPVISGTGPMLLISGSSNRSTISFDASDLQLSLTTLEMSGTIRGPSGANGDVTITSGRALTILADKNITLANINTLINQGTLNLGSKSAILCSGAAFTNSGSVNWTIGLSGSAIYQTSYATLGGSLNLSLGSGISPTINQSIAFFLTTTTAPTNARTIDATGLTVTGDSEWLNNYSPVPSTREYAFTYNTTGQTIAAFAAGQLTVGINGTINLPANTDQNAALTYTLEAVSPATTYAASLLTAPPRLQSGSTVERVRVRFSAPATSVSGTSYASLSSTIECLVTQPAPITINTAPNGPWLYGDQITLSVTTPSNGIPSFSWQGTAPTNATLSGAVVTATDVGASGTVVVTVAASGLYTANSASLNLGSFGPRPVTVTVNGGTRPFNSIPNPNPTFVVSSGSFAGGDDLSSLGTAVYAGTGTSATQLTPVVTGGYPITLTFAPAAPRYSVTAITQGSLIITQAPQTITFAPLAGIQIGQTSTLVATASSGLSVSFVSGTPAVASLSGNVATGLILGSSQITASQAGDSNWLAAPSVNQALAVGLQAQTITFPAIAALKVGETGTLAATASSGLAVTYSSSDTNIAQISGTTVVAIGPGTVTITANQAGNATYAAATPVTASLSVGKADQTITFMAPTTSIEVGASASLGATSSAGLAITYTSSPAAIARISGGTVVGVAPGTATITASQAGNANYNPATDVAVTVTVVAALAGATTGTPEKTPEGGGCGAGSGIALLLGLGAWLGLGFRRRAECSARR